MSCCILRAIYDRLPITDRLKEFQIFAMDTRMLCDIKAETITPLILLLPLFFLYLDPLQVKIGIEFIAKPLHEESFKH